MTGKITHQYRLAGYTQLVSIYSYAHTRSSACSQNTYTSQVAYHSLHLASYIRSTQSQIRTVLKKLIPYKSGVMELMKESTLAITKETNVWCAWVGFNISHGVGILFFSATYLYLSISQAFLLESSLFFMSAAPIISLTYLVLSKKYWFSIPTIGSTIGLLCFVAGTLVQVYA